MLPERQVRLASKAKSITPIGELSGLVAFFEQIGLASLIAGLMPFSYTSPNAYPPAFIWIPGEELSGTQLSNDFKARVFLCGQVTFHLS